jgi:hypothetical protein
MRHCGAFEDHCRRSNAFVLDTSTNKLPAVIPPSSVEATQKKAQMSALAHLPPWMMRVVRVAYLREAESQAGGWTRGRWYSRRDRCRHPAVSRQTQGAAGQQEYLCCIDAPVSLFVWLTGELRVRDTRYPPWLR